MSSPALISVIRAAVPRRTMRLSLITLLLGSVVMAAPVVQASESTSPAVGRTYTAQEQEDIGQIAATYLAQHPEYLVAAQETLRQNQTLAQQQKIALAAPAAAEALLHDKNTPASGPVDAPVAIITFTDYQSADSRKLDTVMAKFIKSHAQVRVISKEFPIYLGRWPVSGEAALAAQQAWNEKGAEGYYTLRNALFASGHVDGAMTTDDVHAAIKAAKASPLKEHEQAKAERDQLNTNLGLGQNLGLTQAPAAIVMAQKGASANTTTVFTSAPTQEQLDRAVLLAGQVK